MFNNISRKRFIIIFVSLLFLILFNVTTLPCSDLIRLMSSSSAFSHAHRVFDQDRGGFLVDEQVDSYQSNGKVIAYIKSTNLSIINLYNIDTDTVTEITSIPGNKSITNFCNDVLVFDVRVKPTNTDVYAYIISTATIKPLATEEGIQKGGATNGKYVVWWNGNESGNLWAYKLDDDTSFKVTENNFPDYNDWYIENCDDYSLRNDLLDYKISKSDFLLYEITMSIDSTLECSRKKIVSYDLQTKTKHILTQGTENDYGFYGVIHDDTVLYSYTEVVKKYEPKQNYFQYTLYSYNPITKQDKDYNNEKWKIFSKKNLIKLKPKPYYIPSFFKDGYDHYCSFAGQVLDLGQESQIYSASKSDRTYFLGDSQVFVGISNPGEYQSNHNIIAYQVESQRKVLITPNNNQNGEKYLSYKNHIISWITSNYNNRLYIRSSPDVMISAKKNRVGLKQNSATSFTVTLHSNQQYITNAGLSYSFPDNPEGLTCSFKETTVQLDGIHDINMTVTINSSASTEKGVYPLELFVQESNFLLPDKITVMVDVADFTIRSEALEGSCYFGMPKTCKLYVKNLLTTEQTYHVEILSDYTEGEGMLVPDFMEYSVNTNSLVIPANEERYVEFSILMKESLAYISYYFIFQVTNTDDQSILTQEFAITLLPRFWLESDRPFLRGSSGSTVTYYLTITANTNYSGTIHLELKRITSDVSYDYLFSQNDFTLLPNEIRFISIDIKFNKICQEDITGINIEATDLISPDINHTYLEFLVNPSFSVDVEPPNNHPTPVNSVGQWKIFVTSDHANRTLVLSRSPHFYPDKNTEFSFDKTSLFFQDSGTQEVILSITLLSDNHRSFPLLVIDSLTGEYLQYMVST